MDELDFSGLSDDQLVELAIAIAKEAARRNPALQAAFAEALATEREKIDARLRGAERARQYEIQQAERVAEAASKAVADEKMRSKRTELLRRYLEQVAYLFRGVIDVLYVGPEIDRAAMGFMRRLAAAAGGDMVSNDISSQAGAQRLLTCIAGLLPGPSRA
ncbi:hypothetical protein [Pseudomonas aeruginosa]|uniref:hypothetical protein n=1 Tax=Pseudomonas aeruginosa TaxID=287 RepID=UPI0016535B48|nr:hypothetical protein [Pseudomonas aeruginosa]MCU8941759.1 hypothetical protein [Pseudomonas aeruginosa]